MSWRFTISPASRSAPAIPAGKRRLGIERDAAAAQLEVEVAGGRSSVAGASDDADRLLRPDPFAAPHGGPAAQVRVEIVAALLASVDQDEPAVEDRVETAAEDPAAARRDQPRPAGRGYVESLMDPAAAARSAELADRPAGAVRPANREDVAMEREAADPAQPVAAAAGEDAVVAVGSSPSRPGQSSPPDPVRQARGRAAVDEPAHDPSIGGPDDPDRAVARPPGREAVANRHRAGVKEGPMRPRRPAHLVDARDRGRSRCRERSEERQRQW